MTKITRRYKEKPQPQDNNTMLEISHRFEWIRAGIKKQSQARDPYFFSNLVAV